ncbi:uncharacterized protein [Triticum aestivum]|uniref:uncharacterized protein n=1 Tax=Triticum aestivum TaxID=4565 RepID=UPI001D00C4EA|nr:uncharacterized protein LOC123061387 [Triticum aestivum]XP_044340405.1 uncharacterized protein LOC123061387 [Triticum aestivum]
MKEREMPSYIRMPFPLTPLMSLFSALGSIRFDLDVALLLLMKVRFALLPDAVTQVAVKASSWLRPSTTSSSCTSSATRTTEFRRFTDDTYIQPDMRMNEQGTGRWIFRSCIDRAKASCVEQFRSCTAIAVARLMATGCSTHGRQARCPRSRSFSTAGEPEMRHQRGGHISERQVLVKGRSRSPAAGQRAPSRAIGT